MQRDENHWIRNFTLTDLKEGKKFIAECSNNTGYENALTIGKTYDVTIAWHDYNTFVDLTGDRGRAVLCSLSRFIKIREVSDAA